MVAGEDLAHDPAELLWQRTVATFSGDWHLQSALNAVTLLYATPSARCSTDEQDETHRNEMSRHAADRAATNGTFAPILVSPRPRREAESPY